jgi:hypothetical protein
MPTVLLGTLTDEQAWLAPQVKAAEVVSLANEAELAKRKAERARQEENELQVHSCIVAAVALSVHCQAPVQASCVLAAIYSHTVCMADAAVHSLHACFRAVSVV